jgi:diaminopimelate decarboxylase
MSPFQHRDGRLCAEGVDLVALAESVGTPTYVYSAGFFEAAYRRYAAAFADRDALVCYAVKANPNIAVIAGFARLGSGADVVSEGELARALAAGVPPRRIVFSGVGKSRADLEAALQSGILQFNVESEPEVVALDQVARALGVRAEIAIRVNPDVDAGTHDKIATGRKGDKFGIDIARAPEIYRLAANRAGIKVAAIAVHIGSQLTSLEPYRAAFAQLRTLCQELRAAGHDIRRLDLGGGLGVTYRDEAPPSVEAYAAVAKQATDGLGCRLMLEPGRWLTANGGLLLTRILYVKEEGGRRFLVLDAAMNDLIRPALYDAYHAVLPVLAPPPGSPLGPVDLVGPVCESTDIFAKDRLLPPLAAGQLVVLLSAGAYGASMASSYNSRPMPSEVLVRNRTSAVIKPRPSLTSLFADERLPPWLIELQAASGDS